MLFRSILLTFYCSLSQTTSKITESQPIIKEYGEIVKDTNIIVRVVGLDSFDSTKLNYVNEVIRDNFGFNSKLSNDTFNIKCLLFKGTQNIDMSQFGDMVYNDTLTVYLTNHRITDEKESHIVGLSSRSSYSIIIDGRFPTDILKTSTIHEIGHIYGLSHCENNYCVMNEDCLGLNNLKFCKKCTDTMYK